MDYDKTNILEDFVKLECDKEMSLDYIEDSVYNITTNKDKFNVLKERALTALELLNYSNNKIYNEIIPLTMNKDSYSTIEKNIDLELKPVLHEKHILEIEIIDLISNYSRSNILSYYINKDSLNNQMYFDMYESQDKSIAGLIDYIYEDARKFSTCAVIYNIKIPYIESALIYDNYKDIFTFIIREENGCGIRSYNASNEKILDVLKLSLGININNILSIERRLIRYHIYDKFKSSYLLNILMNNTILKF